VAAELLTAVGQLHSLDYRHADIKPANFLVTEDNHVCLADLGFADDKPSHAIMVGTPSFLAPEQRCKSGWRQEIRCRLAALAGALRLPRDHRPVDVWQLGVTLMYALCPGGRDRELYAFVAQLASRRRWQRKPQAPSWVPKELHSLLLDCMLVKSRRRRWSVQQLKSHPSFSGVDWAAVQAQGVPLPVDLKAEVGVVDGVIQFDDDGGDDDDEEEEEDSSTVWERECDFASSVYIDLGILT